jgi:hypothetical protein
MGVMLGVCIVVYALFFSSTDEDLIREKLEQLELAIKVSPAETNIVIRGARVKAAFVEIFVKEVSYQIPELRNASRSGRTALAGLAANAPRLWREATVDLDPLTITVDDSGINAVAFGDATLTATRHGGALERDSRTVSLRFDKIDGDWQVVSMSVSAKEGAPQLEGLDE